MDFISLLYRTSAERPREKPEDAPDFFKDLNLDQVVRAVTAGREEYALTPLFYALPTDGDTVRYRQEICRDLEKPPVRQAVDDFARRMRQVRRTLSLVEQLTFPHHREGWFLEAADLYGGAVADLNQRLSSADIRSPGLAAFWDHLHRYAASDSFQRLRRQTQKIKAELAEVRYTVILHNLTVRVRPYAGETDYSGEVIRLFEKFKGDSGKEYPAKLPEGSGMDHVEGQILAFVAKLYPDLFRALEAHYREYLHFPDKNMLIFEREVQFFLAYLEYIEKLKQAGMPFCYPQVAEKDREVYDYDGFDLALAHRLISENRPVVRNDFFLAGPERIIVVYGPNQGGKTTFARTFGQLHYLARLGLPVPGKRARLLLFDRLFTHFEKEEEVKNLRGKLQDDLMRIRLILDEAGPRSIVILNEIFHSTTLQDAVYLSRKIMGKIAALDLLCVWVTFLDELASSGEKVVSMASTVSPENPLIRTFKFLRKPADGLAYALSLAEKHGLTYSRLLERLPR